MAKDKTDAAPTMSAALDALFAPGADAAPKAGGRAPSERDQALSALAYRVADGAPWDLAKARAALAALGDDVNDVADRARVGMDKTCNGFPCTVHNGKPVCLAHAHFTATGSAEWQTPGYFDNL